MTLIELLVVIVLVSTLVTTAIPILSPGDDSRRLREGSRAINALLSSAQIRAVETGRPQGVAFNRLSADTRDPADNGVCVEAYPVEVPPVYSGLDPASRVRMCRRPLQLDMQTRQYPDGALDDPSPVEYWISIVVPNLGGSPQTGMPVGWQSAAIPPRFFRPGDQIEVGGRFFRFIDVGLRNLAGEARVSEAGFFTASDGNTVIVALPARPVSNGSVGLAPKYDNRGQPLPPPEALTRLSQGVNGLGTSEISAPFWTEPAPYKVYRQPAPASGDPVQLSSGVAIDLQASGFANGTPLYQPSGVWNNQAGADEPGLVTDPVMVLFSPEGRLSRVYLPDYSRNGAQTETLATTSLSLLIGRRELAPAPLEEDLRANGYDTPQAQVDNPLILDAMQLVTDEQADELRAAYNWLNLDSRWVVIGAQSGTVTTVPNTFVAWRNPAELDRNGDDVVDLQEQLYAAREAVALRSTEGGR